MSRRYCALAVMLFLFSIVYGSAQQPAQTQPAPENKGTAPATITREQADAILNELRLIRRLLETNGRPTTAAAPGRRHGRRRRACRWVRGGMPWAATTRR